jgi:hypothetical protein
MGYDWPPNRFKTKKNKFNAIRTGGNASKLENAVYQILLLREKAGEISDIRQQRGVHLGCGINWNVDFSFCDNKLNRITWAEAKGIKGERYKICLKLWRDHGPGILEIWEGDYHNPFRSEIVIPLTTRGDQYAK